MQTLTLAATGGTYRLHFVRPDESGLLRDYITAPIAHNASADEVLAAISAVLNPNNINPALPFTDNVAVRRYGTRLPAAVPRRVRGHDRRLGRRRRR